MIKLRVSHRNYLCISRKIVFFRVCDRGLSIEIDRPKLFSERYGHRRVIRIGRISLEVLR